MKDAVDASYQLLAARCVRKQLDALLEQMAGTRKAEDVECIHQARVASRRLRAALRMFRDCFRPGEAKRWRKEIRRFMKQLGRARDRDVQITFVEDGLKRLTDTSHRPGIRRLLLRFRRQRTAVQPKVVKAADRLEASGALEEMQGTVKKMLADPRLKAAGLKSPFVFRQSREQILARLDKLTAYEPCLARPRDKKAHHRMRIAAKRLRYTMELCAPSYEDELKEPIASVRQLQALLGDVHDCDVWVDDLKASMEAECRRTREYFGHERPFARLKPGLEWLRRERQRKRRELFGKLKTTWSQFRREGLWRHLAAMLASRAAAPAEPPLADGTEATGGTAG